jgi:glycosyltransferase involved in cell wall biosynthesis
MRYSFVLPTYNRKEYLKRSLQALNNLSGYTGENYEAVVVDDGSSEETLEYIRGVNHNYRLNYIYLERGEDSCRSRTRNYGISAARGKYIAFIDNDIVVNSDYLQELDRYFSASDNLVIIGTRLDCPADMIGKTDIKDLRARAAGEADPGILDLRHLTLNSLSYNLPAHKYPWMMTLTCNFAAPRKLLLEAEGFDENFKKWGYEDIELGYRLHKAGARFVFNSRIEVFHQSHPLAPPGENNYAHFVRKCEDLVKEIDYVTLFSLQGLSTDDPAVLAVYRNYQGKIRKRESVVLQNESELESVKKRILKLTKKKGSEVIVKDHCESTDLDLWVQMLDVKHALVSYFPRTFTLGKETCLAIVENIVLKKKKF